MTDIKTIKERIGALCETITTLPAPFGSPTAAYSDDDSSFAETSLPIALVRDGHGIAYSQQTERSYLSTREMTVAFYFSRIPDESYTTDDAAWALAESCTEPLVDFFMGYPNLNGLVRECKVSTDSGTRTLMTRHNNSDFMKWRGVVVRLRISYTRSYTMRE
jgi:hypothetical protein